MEINSLKYFIQIYHDRNLTKSAAKLFITQQALSRTIIKMERELGGPLFHRNSRGVKPTELAEYIYPKALAIWGNMIDLKEGLPDPKQPGPVTLRMGFSPGTLQFMGVERLLDFLKRFEDIHFQLSEYSDIVCQEKVLDGSIEAAITLKVENEHQLGFTRLMQDNIVAVVNRQNPLACYSAIDLQQLAGQPLIMLDDTFQIQHLMMNIFRDKGIEPHIVTRINHDLSVAFDLVSLNRGIFVFVAGLSQIREYGNLLLIPLREDNAKWEIGLMTRKDSPHAALLRHLEQEIERHFLQGVAQEKESAASLPVR